MISAIVLAAGQGRRMGQTKQLLSIGKRSMIKQVVDTLLQADIGQVVVVLGYQAEQVAQELRGLELIRVYNSDYAAGQSTSLRKGILAASRQTQGYLLVLGDQPFVRADTIKQLIAHFDPDQRRIIAPCYQSKRGNPVLFHASFGKELVAVEGDQGARQLFAKYRALVQLVSVDDPGVVQDIDTMADYHRLTEVGRNAE